MRALPAAAAAALALTLAAAAAAAALDTSHFRYERALAPASVAPIRLEPDGPMYAHSRIGFADVRVLDAAETQTPWRTLPAERGSAPQEARVLNAGRRNGAAVALLDLGPVRRVRDRVELDVPDQGFVGRVLVSGSQNRRTFTRLGTSVIYDVRNAAVPARSTTVVFPPSDFRYLFLRATGISRIHGATVAAAPETAQRIERHGTLRRVSADPTRLVLDLGYRNLPVDELFVSAATPRYDRDATVSGSNDGRTWVDLARTRVFKLSGSVSSPIEVSARHRYLRLTIFNGDDEPLRAVGLRAFARSRALLVEGGHPGPLRMLYGDPQASPPSYDFARLPVAELALARARTGRLGREAANATFEPRADTRSFSAKHPAVITAALVLAGAVVAVGGFLALRRRA